MTTIVYREGTAQERLRIAADTMPLGLRFYERDTRVTFEIVTSPDGWRAWQIVPGTVPGSDNILRRTEITQAGPIRPGPANQRYYLNPARFFSDVFSSKLETSIDGGVTWTTLVRGVDYEHLARNFTSDPAFGTVPPTVADAMIGFRFLNAPPEPALYRFTLQFLSVLLPPPSLMAVRTVLDAGGYIPDAAAAVFKPSIGGVQPNSLLVSVLPGYQIEFWRRSHKNGTTSFCDPATGRNSVTGKRLVPYYRGPSTNAGQLPGLFHADEFSPVGRSSFAYFQVCYYDTATGARSELSRETIVVGGHHSEFVSTSAGGARVNSGSPRRFSSASDVGVWIQL